MAPEITALSELLQQQFEAHQLDEGTHSSASRVVSIKKQITVFTLNQGVHNLSLGGSSSSSSSSTTKRNDENVDESIASILVTYIDAAMAMEISSETQEPVDRVLDLSAALAVSYGEIVTDAVVARAVEFSRVLLERVRGQACRLMGFLASHLVTKQEEDWAKESLEDIETAMVDRLSDKSQSVRNQAIRASAHFFDEFQDNENDNTLLETLLWSMWHDPSVANRMAAVDAVPISSRHTLDHIITRVRDVKEKVRIAALDVLRTKVDPVTDLTQDQFAEVVRSSLAVR
jgi:hypothetical protein